MEINIKKKNRGKFTRSAKAAGQSVQEYAHTVLNNPKATTLQKKRAQFAINASKWKHEEGGAIHKPYGHRSVLDNGWIPTRELKKRHPIATFQEGGTPYLISSSQPAILQRYITLVNRGIKPQLAFDTSHLSMIEDGRQGKYYSFGKRATTLNGWGDNVTDSLTTGRYRNLQNTSNFNQFKQALKSKNYNIRPAFYNTEINRGRNKDKQIVNEWNQQNGLSPIAGIFNNYNGLS